jgi:acyl carrier protein
VLKECAVVSQAVVVAREEKQGGVRLVGYVVPAGEFDKEGITAYLKEKLPDYMIPAVLMEMESLPLTANGKVDRKALPDPEATGLAGDQYVAPRNEAEKILCAIWQDLLEVERIGINDDFFELGGHSLLAVRLVSAIRKQFSVEMPISDIFDYPTIAALAPQLEIQSDATILPSIGVSASRPERIPLSFSQERLWFIDRLEGSVQYHLPSVLRLKGKLNSEALAYALQSIVDRTRFSELCFRRTQGQAYQHVRSLNEWRLVCIDGSKYKEDNEGLQQYIQQLISKPFMLSKDHMVRAALVALDGQDHVLVVTMHHIASDAWSTSILVKEVVELYSSYEEDRPAQLPPMRLQYADYALWQRNYLRGPFWTRRLATGKRSCKEYRPCSCLRITAGRLFKA